MRLPKDGQILLGCTYVCSPISGELARTGAVTSLSSHSRPRESHPPTPPSVLHQRLVGAACAGSGCGSLLSNYVLYSVEWIHGLDVGAGAGARSPETDGISSKSLGQEEGKGAWTQLGSSLEKQLSHSECAG